MTESFQAQRKSIYYQNAILVITIALVLIVSKPESSVYIMQCLWAQPINYVLLIIEEMGFCSPRNIPTQGIVPSKIENHAIFFQKLYLFLQYLIPFSLPCSSVWNHRPEGICIEYRAQELNSRFLQVLSHFQDQQRNWSCSFSRISASVCSSSFFLRVFPTGHVLWWYARVIKGRWDNTIHLIHRVNLNKFIFIV